MKAENRHYSKVWAKKEHDGAKCKKAKCIICHYGKVTNQIKISDKKRNNPLNRNISDD